MYTKTKFFITALLSAFLTGSIAHAATADVTKSEVPTVIKFYAPWCGACKAIADSFHEISKDPEFKGVKFVEVNIDEQGQLAQDNGVVGIPTFLYVQNGTTKHKEVGIKNMETFKQAMRQTIRNTFNVSLNQSIDAHVDTHGHTTATAQPTTQHAATEAQTAAAQPIVPAQPAVHGHEAGLLTKIHAMFITIFTKIKDMIIGIFHWIKSLFAR